MWIDYSKDVDEQLKNLDRDAKKSFILLSGGFLIFFVVMFWFVTIYATRFTYEDILSREQYEADVKYITNSCSTPVPADERLYAHPLGIHVFNSKTECVVNGVEIFRSQIKQAQQLYDDHGVRFEYIPLQQRR